MSQIITKDPYVANKKMGLYWCNGKNPACGKERCYINDGPCFCTHNPLFKAPSYEVFDSEKRVNLYNKWNSGKIG